MESGIIVKALVCCYSIGVKKQSYHDRQEVYVQIASQKRKRFPLSVTEMYGIAKR